MTGPVVLQRTRFTDVPENRETQVKAYDGMTSSSYAFLVLSLGNPSSYRSVAWGVNDTCAALAGQDEEQRLRPWADWSGRKQPKGEINRSWSEFSTSEREKLGRAEVNTYAETSPSTEIAKVFPQQVGVDRIVVRP